MTLAGEPALFSESQRSFARSNTSSFSVNVALDGELEELDARRRLLPHMAMAAGTLAVKEARQ